MTTIHALRKDRLARPPLDERRTIRPVQFERMNQSRLADVIAAHATTRIVSIVEKRLTDIIEKTVKSALHQFEIRLEEQTRLIEQTRESVRATMTQTVQSIVAATMASDLPDEESDDVRPELRKGTVEEMLTSSRARGEMLYNSLKNDPEMVTAEVFADRLGVTPQTIHNRRRAGELIGLTQGGRKVWFPLVQLDPDGRPLEGLKDILEACDRSEWAVYRFLSSSHQALNQRLGRDVLISKELSSALVFLRCSKDTFAT